MKTFERLIKFRLEWYINSNGLLSDFQFGHKTGFGTLDAISVLVTDIQLCFMENHYTGAAFLDVKGAFDSVQLDTLYHKMCQINIPPKTSKHHS
nr:unnamed protein product [Callosobruchus chinensis]